MKWPLATPSSRASLGPCEPWDRPLKILVIYMYINNKIYWFIRNMSQNICYSTKKHQTRAVQVVHLCSCMYLNQRRDRDDVLDFKQVIDAAIQCHLAGQESGRIWQAKPSSSM
jgi:hypothetical protein